MLTACTGTGKRNTTVLKIPAGAFSKYESINSSIDQLDILMANMQKVPIPPLGASKRDVILMLEKNSINIITNSEQRLLVSGSSKPTKSVQNARNANSVTIVETEVSVVNPDSFEFKFEQGLLVSGPKLTQLTERK